MLLERIQQRRSVVVGQLADTRAEAVGFYRLLENPKLSVERCVQALTTQTALGVGRRHVLAIHDSSEINLSAHQNRLRGQDFGVVGRGRDPGLYVHPMLIVDALEETTLGWSAIHLWGRDPSQADKTQRQYQQQAYEAKESRIWRDAMETTEQNLSQATLTFIADRESDIFEVWDHFDGIGTQGLIRACQNRKLADGERLFTRLAQGECLGQTSCEVKADPRRKQQARTARLEVRVSRLEIPRPGRCRTRECSDALLLYGVEVREVNCPVGQSPILWRLLTTHRVQDFEQAQQMVRWYQLRWRIERVFHVLKRGVLQVEDTQLEQSISVEKLVVFALAACLPLLTLLEARDGGAPQSAHHLFEAHELACLTELGPCFEGRTLAQKNPHGVHSVSWASWIIARLGSWKGYASERPPGTKTFALGLRRFAHIFYGWSLAQPR